MNFKTSTLSRIVLILGICVLGFIANRWVVHPDNYFGLDDFGHFKVLMNRGDGTVFTALPSAYYNDRPMGWVLIQVLLKEFKLDHVGHHVVLLGFHLLNAALVYIFAEWLAGVFETTRPVRKSLVAWLAAAIFVSWPSSNLAPSWDAAVFDLLGCTFTLLFLISFARFFTTPYRYFYVVTMALCLWLGLRSKEMVIVVPFIAMLILLAMARFSAGKEGAGLKDAFSIKVISGLCIAAGFYFIYLRLINVDQSFGNDPSNPYYQSFAPSGLLGNVFRYTLLTFDLSIPSNQIQMPVGADWLWMCFPGFILTVGLYTLIRHRSPLVLLALVLAVMQIAPVLPMVKMQHRLYLYLPMIFLAISMAGAIDAVIPVLKGRLNLFAGTAAALFCAAGLLFLGEMPCPKIHRRWWMQVGTENRQAFSFLRALPRFPEGAVVEVLNVPANFQGINIFAASNGDALKLLGQPESIVISIHKPGETATSPKSFVVDYAGGKPVLVSKPLP